MIELSELQDAAQKSAAAGSPGAPASASAPESSSSFSRADMRRASLSPLMVSASTEVTLRDVCCGLASSARAPPKALDSHGVFSIMRLYWEFKCQGNTEEGPCESIQNG